MTRSHRELDALAAKERLTLLRNWCLGIGVVVFLIAITASGPTNIYNPKVWDSAYYAWAALGALTQFSIALFGVGLFFGGHWDYLCRLSSERVALANRLTSRWNELDSHRAPLEKTSPCRRSLPVIISVKADQCIIRCQQ